MMPSDDSLGERVARAALTLLAIGVIAAFFLSCLQRLPSTIELGNGEGMLLDHAIRVANGLPLYTAPSAQWVPLAYMPGFPLLAAPFVHWFGPQFWIGRLIDILALAGLVVVFALAMRGETKRWSLGLVGIALFLMGQGFSQGCYDVWRPDPPMLFFAFCGAAMLRYSSDARGAVLSGLLFSIAFLFKQHGVVLGLSMIPYLWFADRRRVVPYTVSLFVFAFGFFGILRLILGPWFPFYTVDVPSHWSTVNRMHIQRYLGQETFGRFAMLTVPAVIALATRPWRDKPGLWWWLGLGGVGTGLMATLDPYAAYHTLMLGFATFAFVGPLALHRMGAELPSDRRALWNWVMVAVIVAQMIALPFSPRALKPHQHTAGQLQDFVNWVKSRKNVIVIYHGYYTWAAGQGTGVSMLPFDDVVRARGSSLYRRDPKYFDRMFDRLRSGPNRPILVSDTTLDKTGDSAREYWASLAPGYRLEGSLGDLAREVAPVVGQHDMPKYVYVPVEPDSAAAPAADSTGH